MIYSLIKEDFILNVDLVKIMNTHIFNDSCYVLVENEMLENAKSQAILRISLKELAITKTTFVNNEIRDIFIWQEDELTFLF